MRSNGIRFSLLLLKTSPTTEQHYQKPKYSIGDEVVWEILENGTVVTRKAGIISLVTKRESEDERGIEFYGYFKYNIADAGGEMIGEGVAENVLTVKS